MELNITQLAITVGQQTLLSGIDFDAQSGDVVGLVGPSGSGKTTLLNTLGLLLPVSDGRILYDHDDVRAWNRRRVSRFWRDSASFVIQDAGIDEDESVLYNVTLTTRVLGAKKDNPEAVAALTKVGLAGRVHDSARVLSGGEQRRVAIARAMYRRSAIIFADEPTASLDEDNRQLVQSLLLAEAERGALVVVSTHDLEFARHCTKVLDLSKYAKPLLM